MATETVPLTIGAAGAPTQAAPSRSWQFERNRHRGCFLGSFDNQLSRYLAAKSRPTCRNRGPKGRDAGLSVGYQFVTLDVTADEAIAMTRGKLLPPEGCTRLKNLEVDGPFFVRRQAKKALARWRQRFPLAKLRGWRMAKTCKGEEVQGSPGTRVMRGIPVYGVRQWA